MPSYRTLITQWPTYYIHTIYWYRAKFEQEKKNSTYRYFEHIFNPRFWRLSFFRTNQQENLLQIRTWVQQFLNQNLREWFSSQNKKTNLCYVSLGFYFIIFRKNKKWREIYLWSSDQNKIITLPIKPEPPVIKIVLSLYNSCIGVNCSERLISIDYL